MAGLQEIAALIGIAELAFRSISSLHDFVSGLKQVPKKLESLQNEISTLLQSFSALEFLKVADVETRAIVTRVGVPEAIENCASACQELQNDLSRWTKSSKQNIASKIHFRLHQKAVNDVLAQISLAKQTTILCINITQLSVQLKDTLSDSRRASRIALVERQIIEASEAEQQRRRHLLRRDPVIGTSVSPQKLAQIEIENMKGGSLQSNLDERPPSSTTKPAQAEPGKQSLVLYKQKPVATKVKDEPEGVGEDPAAPSTGGNMPDATENQPRTGLLIQTFKQVKAGGDLNSKQGNSNSWEFIKQTYEPIDAIGTLETEQGCDNTAVGMNQEFDKVEGKNKVTTKQGIGNRSTRR